MADLADAVVGPFGDLAVFHQEDARQMIGDVTFGASEGIYSFVYHHRTSHPAIEDLKLDGCGALHIAADTRDRFGAFDCRGGIRNSIDDVWREEPGDFRHVACGETFTKSGYQVQIG